MKFYQGQKATSSCVFSHVWLFVTPWTVACRTPLSMGFSRQEYWSGLPFPPLGDLPGPGIKPASSVPPASISWFFTTEPSGKPKILHSRSPITPNLESCQKSKDNVCLSWGWGRGEHPFLNNLIQSQISKFFPFPWRRPGSFTRSLIIKRKSLTISSTSKTLVVRVR